MQGARRQKKGAGGFEDISHYFLSAAEADAPQDATGTAGRPAASTTGRTSAKESPSRAKSSQPARRKDTCASCAHLIARTGRPFQCRIFSVEYEKHKVERRDKLDINEGRTCPYFMRITSKQIEDILSSHGSSLNTETVREFAHTVDEKVIRTKTITISPQPGTSAEEVLREELLRYLTDGYSIVEAVITKQEDQTESKHTKTTTQKVRLRVKQDG